MELRAQLERQQKDIVDKIREYSRSQQELWQEFPYRALRACSGYRPTSEFEQNISLATRFGYYAIEEMGRTYVDLRNGELLLIEGDDYFRITELDFSIGGKRDELRFPSAKDADILRGFVDLSCIDAKAILDRIDDKAFSVAQEYGKDHVDTMNNLIYRKQLLDSYWKPLFKK